MINRINYVHSLFFFIFCILISSFGYLRSNSFILVCFFLILTLGISHGSLDNLKGKKLIKIYKIKNMFLFYLSYILIGIFIILSWLISAYILLAIFLIVASYHFGKEDAEFLNTRKKENIFLYFLKGSSVIISPLLFNQGETLEIFNNLNFYLSNTVFINTKLLIIFLFLSFLSNLFLSLGKSFDEKSIVFMDFFSIIILNIFLNPILAFTIYFCFLHSIRHSIKLSFELNKDVYKGLILFIKKAIPLTILTAIIFLIILYFLQNNFEFDQSINQVIFIGLASLTFPHILLEYLIEKNAK